MPVNADLRDDLSRNYRVVEHELGQRILLHRTISATPPGWREVERHDGQNLPDEYRELPQIDRLEDLPAS